MIFTEPRFFGFFALVFIVYWLLHSNALRKAWLLVASALFYAAWDWRFLGLVCITIANTYVATLAMAAVKAPRIRVAILTSSLTLALLILGYFKYYNFFIESLTAILPLDWVTQTIILPVGISFYTFHAASYLIDTYRAKIAPTRNLVDVSLYILFFPQLVAGPIVRATDLLPQMERSRGIDGDAAKYFLTLFVVGFFKKAVVSDGLASTVDTFFADPARFGAGDAAVAVFSYAVQIYCDFSGYTDMAIAVAGLLGYQLKRNFNHPYLAPNLIEFWRRWHISLSSWLRDYVYIALGGNRGGYAFQIRNIVITMLLGGLWHGASWTFIVWGAMHGIGLAVCHTVVYVWPATRAYSIVGNLVTFLFVSAAWILFRSPDFVTALSVFERFTVPLLPTLIGWNYFLVLAGALTATHVAFYQLDLHALTSKTNNSAFAVVLGAVIAVMLPLISMDVKPFIYFQF